MEISLKLLHKFFLAFFITNLSLVGLMLVMIAYNFSTGFNEFVSNAEKQQVADAKQQLINLYGQHNNWQPIVNNVQIWRDIVDPRPGPPPPRANDRQGSKNERPRDNRPRNKQAPPAAPPKPRVDNPADFLKTGRRLSLYDQNKNVIVGKKHLNDNSQVQAIQVNGQVVGWLGLVPSNAVKDSPASEFLAKQTENYYLIAAAIILLAGVMALLLSRHLIAPIKKIIEGTNKLIGGKYNSRIEKVTQDELGLLSDNFNDLAHTLEQNQKNRFQWMSDTSHELRTPLTVLKSHLTAIQDGIFEASEKRIQLFIDEIDSLSHIVDDLYQLSSSDAGALTYVKVPLNPLQILSQVIEGFKPKFEQHALAVNYDSLTTLLAHHSCDILGDKDRLRQLFTNLLENSCRYTHENGQIQVLAKIDKQQLILDIQDSAPAVARELHPKLFERFYRVEKSRNRDHGGSGLGLALCQQIVEAHRGTISATDSPLGGLNIKIRFQFK